MSEQIIPGLQEGHDYIWETVEDGNRSGNPSLGKLTLLSGKAKHAADSAWVDQAWPFKFLTTLPHLSDNPNNVNELLFSNPEDSDYQYLHLILQVYSTK